MSMSTLVAVALLLRLGACGGSTQGYVLVSADSHDLTKPAAIATSVLPGAGNVSASRAPPGVNGYRAVVDNAAPYFRAFGPLGGAPCGKRVKTSVTAAAHKCRLATNAGPFDMANGM